MTPSCCAGRRRKRAKHAEFDQPFAAVGTWTDGTVTPGSTSASGGTQFGRNGFPVPGKGSGAYLRFADGATVGMRVGISYVSEDNARANLAAENRAGTPMQRIRDRIKAITAPRHKLAEPVGPIVTEVNQTVRGWGAYFRVGNSARKFDQVDDYVRERLVLFLSKKTGRRGPLRKRYDAAYFQKLGVYTLSGTVKWNMAAPTATR